MYSSIKVVTGWTNLPEGVAILVGSLGKLLGLSLSCVALGLLGVLRLSIAGVLGLSSLGRHLVLMVETQ